MRTYSQIADVSIVIINLLGIVTLKGGPIHKPYWLSWDSLSYLFFCNFSILCMAKMTINNKLDSYFRI